MVSRRAAEKLIAEGLVTVNGAVATLGMSVEEGDEIAIRGEPLPEAGERVYIMLNKPRGYVTTMSDDRGRRTVAELVADCGARVYAVGRLDMDSEGLLIMTNDGELAHRLMHPSFEVQKTYRVVLRDAASDDALERLRAPIEMDGTTVQAKNVERVRALRGNKSVINITIGEGRNRQIRRMCAAVGLNVDRLRRIAEGDLKLGDLPSGKWRELTEQEINLLRKDGENVG